MGPQLYAARAFYSQEVTAMTEQQRAKLMEALEKQAAKNATSPEAALKFLIETGTYTPQGNLAPEFGGPGYDEQD
jgi:conjugal transfer/entry exclusion protein